MPSGLDAVNTTPVNDSLDASTQVLEQPLTQLATAKMLQPKASKYATPTSTIDAPIPQSVLENMERIAMEKAAGQGSMVNTLKDVLAFFPGDPTLRSQSLATRSAEREQESADIFNMQNAIAQNKAAQEQAAQTGKLNQSIITGGGAGGAPAGGLDVSFTLAEQRYLNTLRPEEQKKEIAKLMAVKSKALAEAKLRKDFFEPTIEVKVGPNRIETISLNDYYSNPEKWQPTAKGKAAIQVQSEGSKELPLNLRNNNPGNLVDPKTGELLKFKTMEEGQAALDKDVDLKISGQSAAHKSRFGDKPVTPTTFTETWAPSTAKGNTPESTANYAKFVASKLGIDVNTPIPNTPEAKKIVAAAVSEFEGKAPTAMPKPTVQATTTAAPAKDLTLPERKAAAKITEEGNIAAVREESKQNAPLETQINTLGQSAGDRYNRYTDVISLAGDKEVADMLGKLQKSGLAPFVLKRLESGVNAGNFGAIGLKNLEEDLAKVGASDTAIAKFMTIARHLKQAELEYAREYLKGQGSVSDNERELIRAAVGSIKDPAKLLIKQAEILKERAEFDRDMAALRRQHRKSAKESGGYSSYTDFIDSDDVQNLITQHNAKLAGILSVDPSKVKNNNPLKAPGAGGEEKAPAGASSDEKKRWADKYK